MNRHTAKCVIIVLLILVFQNTHAQLTDLARLEYSYIPKSKSEDNFNRFRALINYPIKTQTDCYLVVGGEYSRIALNLEDNYPFDISNLNRLHVIDLNIGYTFKLNNDWRLGAKLSPRIASTLTHKLSGDDFFLNGGVYAIKDRTKEESLKRPYRLILGLTYNSTTGIPLPLPFISYYRRVNENWSFNLGVPKTNVKYFFNERNIVQTFVGIDGYFANIQDNIVLDGNQAENISLSVIVAGLGYEYCFTDHLIWYAYTGHTISMSNRLRDNNRDDIYRLDKVNAFYLRTGIKFKI
ncbi:hypothetical protein CLV86_1639 [Lacinutrix venerupis]|uniref:DUF6268 domain-containing protein n=1 Tax=Lacinutrix venerupis TaxID=1486034 RepID=A0AAC9PXI3_9FLAO|nr:DUF6268 family outer membrane beta-barrel protein [Lacinutrix venerupis]APY00863.1 hypothetical protein BWR22_11245 [Lacinutrix venerupis]RLJ64518.1 hypothetical protein CLV86_1639 [Lacinutrix venerupis]